MISAALRPRGYRVLTASNGREAQALAQKHAKIDLLLTDIEMPEMRGDELAGWFRAAHGGTQILFMSSQRTAREALGPAHFLQKPFRAEALLSKVHEILDQPSAISAKTTP